MVLTTQILRITLARLKGYTTAKKRSKAMTTKVRTEAAMDSAKEK